MNLRRCLLFLCLCLGPALCLAQSLISVTLAPNAVGGGLTSTGTVTLSKAAPSSGEKVSLSSNELFAKAPASVKIASGKTTATFTVTTLPVGVTGSATISANLATVTKAAKLTIYAPALTGLALNPTSVAGGASSAGTVTLSSKAPIGGTSVTFASNAAFAYVPVSVVVPAGSESARFAIRTLAVAINSNASISVSLGSITKRATLSVKAPLLAEFTLSKSSVVEGTDATGTVTLATIAPASGLRVKVTSSAAYVIPPVEVTVPAGAKRVSFTVRTTKVAVARTAIVTASDGSSKLTQSLTVEVPAGPSVLLIPPQVAGGMGATAVVTLASAAPAGGTTVSVTASNFFAGLPAKVIVPQGQNWAWVPVRTVTVAAPTTAKISAEGAGSAILTMNPSGYQPGSPWPAFHRAGDNSGRALASPPNAILKWSAPAGLPNNTMTSPAIAADGTVYIGSAGGSLCAYWPDGAPKWTVTSGEILGSPAIGFDGTVYLASLDDYLYAINPDGSPKWKFLTGGLFLASPIIGTDGTIYIGSLDDNLYAMNPDGSLKWAYATGGQIQNSAAFGADGTIYVGSDDGRLYAVDPNGALQWTFGTGSYISTPPTVGPDGTIYAGFGNDEYAITPAGAGRVLLNVGSPVQYSAAIGPDGTVYFATLFWIYGVSPTGGVTKFAADGIAGPPIVAADGTLCVGVSDGSLYHFNPDGTLDWAYETGGTVGPPAIGADGTVYAGSADGHLYAVGAQPAWAMDRSGPRGAGLALDSGPAGTGGTTLWTANIVGFYFMVGATGVVYASSEANGIAALDPADGSIKWSYPVDPGTFFEGIALGPDETVYFVIRSSLSQTGNLTALSPIDGSLLWTTEVGVGYFQPVVGPDGTIYVSGNQTMLALEPQHGRILWSYKAPEILTSAALGADGTVYCGGYHTGLYTISAKGSLLWKFAADGIGYPPAVGLDGTVYFGSNDANIYAVTSAGKLVWKYQTGAFVLSPTLALDGTVYAGSGDGYFYAVNADGSLKWRYNANAQVSAGAIGADGTIYITGTQLVALNPATGAPVWTYPIAYPGPVTMGRNGILYVPKVYSLLYAIGH